MAVRETLNDRRVGQEVTREVSIATISALEAITHPEDHSGKEAIRKLKHVWRVSQAGGADGGCAESEEEEEEEEEVELSLRAPRQSRRPLDVVKLGVSSTPLDKELARFRRLKESLHLDPGLSPAEVTAALLAADKAEQDATSKRSRFEPPARHAFGSTSRFGPINGGLFRQGDPSSQSSRTVSSKANPSAARVHNKLYEDATVRQRHLNSKAEQVANSSPPPPPVNNPPSLSSGSDNFKPAPVCQRLHSDATERRNRKGQFLRGEWTDNPKENATERKSKGTFSKAGRTAPVAFFHAPGDLIDDSHRATTARRFEGDGAVYLGSTAVAITAKTQLAPWWVDGSVLDPGSRKGFDRRTKAWLVNVAASCAALKLGAILRIHRELNSVAKKKQRSLAAPGIQQGTKTPSSSSSSQQQQQQQQQQKQKRLFLGYAVQLFGGAEAAGCVYKQLLSGRSNSESKITPPRSGAAGTAIESTSLSFHQSRRRKWWALGRQEYSPGSTGPQFSPGGSTHHFYTRTLRSDTTAMPTATKLCADNKDSLSATAVKRLWADAEDRGKRLTERMAADASGAAFRSKFEWQTLMFSRVPNEITGDALRNALKNFLGVLPHHPGTGGIVSIFDHAKLACDGGVDGGRNDDELVVAATAAAAEASAADELEYLALVYHDGKRFLLAEEMLTKVLETREAALQIVGDAAHALSDRADLTALTRQLARSAMATMKKLAVALRASGGRFRFRDAGSLDRRAEQMKKEWRPSNGDTPLRALSAVQAPWKRESWRRVTVRCAGIGPARKLLNLNGRIKWGTLVEAAHLDGSGSECIKVSLSLRHLLPGTRVAHKSGTSATVVWVRETDDTTAVALPVHDAQGERIESFVRTSLVRKKSYHLVMDIGSRASNVVAADILRAWLPRQQQWVPDVSQRPGDFPKTSYSSKLRNKSRDKYRTMCRGLKLRTRLLIRGLNDFWTEEAVRDLVDGAMSEASQNDVAHGSILRINLTHAASASTTARSNQPHSTIEAFVDILGRRAAASVALALDDSTVPIQPMLNAPSKAETGAIEGIPKTLESSGGDEGDDNEYDVDDDYEDDFEDDGKKNTDEEMPTRKEDANQSTEKRIRLSLEISPNRSSCVEVSLEWLTGEDDFITTDDEIETSLWWYLDYVLVAHEGSEEGAMRVLDCRVERKVRPAAGGRFVRCGVIDVEGAEPAQRLLLCLRNNSRVGISESDKTSTLAPLKERFQHLRGRLTSGITSTLESMTSPAYSFPKAEKATVNAVVSCHPLSSGKQRAFAVLNVVDEELNALLRGEVMGPSAESFKGDTENPLPLTPPRESRSASQTGHDDSSFDHIGGKRNDALEEDLKTLVTIDGLDIAGTGEGEDSEGGPTKVAEDESLEILSTQPDKQEEDETAPSPPLIVPPSSFDKEESKTLVTVDRLDTAGEGEDGEERPRKVIQDEPLQILSTPPDKHEDDINASSPRLVAPPPSFDTSPLQSFGLSQSRTKESVHHRLYRQGVLKLKGQQPRPKQSEIRLREHVEKQATLQAATLVCPQPEAARDIFCDSPENITQLSSTQMAVDGVSEAETLPDKPAVSTPAQTADDIFSWVHAIKDFYGETGGNRGEWLCDEGWAELQHSGRAATKDLFGVTVDTSAGEDHVSSLKLPGNGLYGAVGAVQIPLASFLRAGVVLEINLSFNGLDGNLSELLPWELLGNLRFLSLAGNYLCGSIPEAIGSLQSAEEISLCANQLRGRLPTSIGPRHLPALRVLTVSENLLSGSLDVLFASSRDTDAHPDYKANEISITRLDVSSNGFGDEAWRDIIAAAHKGLLPHLTSLYLGNNPFKEGSREAHTRLRGVLSRFTDIVI